MAERKLLGESLSLEEKIALAQLSAQPGWTIFVRLMAESCRNATEAVIKLDPATPRYPEVLAALQTTARAKHQFSSDILDSIKIHNKRALDESERQQNPLKAIEPKNRFEAAGGFRPPTPKLVKQQSAPTEGAAE